MKLPVIITNFKTFESATGKRAYELALIHEKVAQETGASIAIAVQAVDLRMIALKVSIPVLAQHFDPITYGANTGHLLPEALKEAGAYGSLLNHSERRIDLDRIEESLKRAREVGFFVVVCANDPEEGARIKTLNPDLIAIEPPELIGGEISVSKAKPEVIKSAVALIGEGKTLVGAGVKNGEDVRIAIKLGASGVLLASGVTKAGDPEAVLRDLCRGLTQ